MPERRAPARPGAWAAGWIGAACVALAGCAGAGKGPDGRYVGTVTPRPAVSGARCGDPTRGLLALQDGAFTFAPNEGVLVIPGRLDADGSLHGTLPLHGSTATPSDVPGERRPAPARSTPTQQLAFDGRLDGDHVTGVITEPRCTAAVDLVRR